MQEIHLLCPNPANTVKLHILRYIINGSFGFFFFLRFDFPFSEAELPKLAHSFLLLSLFVLNASELICRAFCILEIDLFKLYTCITEFSVFNSQVDCMKRF